MGGSEERSGEEKSMCCQGHPHRYPLSLASGFLELQLSESPSSSTALSDETSFFFFLFLFSLFYYC